MRQPKHMANFVRDRRADNVVMPAPSEHGMGARRELLRETIRDVLCAPDRYHHRTVESFVHRSDTAVCPSGRAVL
jgi:hypothetical protein